MLSFCTMIDGRLIKLSQAARSLEFSTFQSLRPVKGTTWTSTPSSPPSNSHFICFVFLCFCPICVQLLSNTCLSVSVNNLSPNCTFLPRKVGRRSPAEFPFSVSAAPLHTALSVCWKHNNVWTVSNIFLDIWRDIRKITHKKSERRSFHITSV